MDAALKSHLMLNSRLCVCQPYRLFGLRPISTHAAPNACPIYARIPHSPAFCTLGVINFSTPLPAGREGKEACKILRPRANATRSVVQSSATHNRYIYLVPRFANVQRQGLDRANKTTNRRDMMLHQRREHTGGGTDTTESRPPDGTLFDRLRFRVGNIFLSSVRSVWLRLSRTHRIRFAHPAQNRALKGLSCCRPGGARRGKLGGADK